MEVVEETVGGMDQFLVIKGRRTKRPRPSSPFSLASTSNVGGSTSGNDGSSSSAAVSTIEFFQNTKEEEDMANCLILLAHGRQECTQQTQHKRRIMETRDEGLEGAYECKTCNRSFPSFQALGGHRASHKKPKAAIDEEKKDLPERKMETDATNSDQPLVLQADHQHKAGKNTTKSKVHGCSICGSEFSSGQALGGHMRRHRNMIASMAADKEYADDQKSRNVFGWDLNLPAPEEDVFSSKQPPLPLVFSAPALVDCHY